jgi:hypothetical protein
VTCVAAARWAMAAMGSSIGLHGNKVGSDDFSYIGNLFPTTVSNPNNRDEKRVVVSCFAIDN